MAKYQGTPYHLWNPFTVMDDFLPLLGVGPLVITRGDGPFYYNNYDKKYLNGMSGLWNVALGYGREELIDAAHNQMKELAFASCFRQVHPRAIELAARLIEITGERYNRVYLGSNGSEAIETAIKIARQYHRQSSNKDEHAKYKIISLKHSYHGVSYGAMSTSGLESEAEKFGPVMPGFVQIDPPYCYRCPYGMKSYPECGLACASALDEKIKKEKPEKVSAFILEPIMGSYGFIKPPEEYYKRVAEICKKHSVLLIADEVTTGFGRTGKLFMSRDWDPEPDIMCLGKAISSGYQPLSATLVKEYIYKRFKGRENSFMHGSTNSGHPVCAAVGLATIDIMTKEDIPSNAAKMGRYLMDQLHELSGRRELIGEVRGTGLMIGLELVTDREKKTPVSDRKIFDIILDFATLGLVTYYTRNVLGLMPPLIIDEAFADEMVGIIDKALDTSVSANVARKARMAREFARAKLS